MKQSQHRVQNTKEGQIDLALLWRIFVGNLWKILLVAVLLAGLLGGLRYFTSRTNYSVRVDFFVNGLTLTKIDNELTYTSSGSYAGTVGAQFAMSAPNIISGRNTLDKVCDYLKSDAMADSPYYEDYQTFTSRNISPLLGVTYDEQIVEVYVVHPDPQVAHDVAMAFHAVVPDQMDFYYGIEEQYNSTDETETDELGNTVTLPEGKHVANPLNSVPAVEDIQQYHAVGRGTTKYAAIGFLIGALAMFVFYFIRAYFDNTVYSEDDLQDYFDLPVIGQIPDWSNMADAAGASDKQKEAARKRARKMTKKKLSRSDNLSDRDYSGRLLNSKTPFAINEAFKNLRTNMCYTTKGEKCAVYGVTSAYVQAGKSLVIANLAVSFAMMGKKVLLVDGDLRCPAQHRVFGITNRVNGLSNVLAGICTYEDMELRDGGYENLSILTCGKLPPNPAELLASDKMREFLEAARRDYDIVFVDLPPVSEVSDAGIISKLVTGFAFVVRAGYSDRRMVDAALESMDGFEAPLTGFILNDIDVKSGKYYQNKYYKYGGKYARYERKFGRYGSYGSPYIHQDNNQGK